MIYYLTPKHNRVFLDTNVVWNLHTFGEEIYSGVDFGKNAAASKLGNREIQDLIALRELAYIAERYGSIVFVTAENTIKELERRANNSKGAGRLSWGYELLDWWNRELDLNYPDEDFTYSAQRDCCQRDFCLSPDSTPHNMPAD